MSDLAEDQLAAFVDRILRLKAEADDIAADIKEIYAEAKANGFDKTRLGDTVTKARKMDKDPTAEAEKEALNDLYWSAYCRSKKLPHAHAYARDEENDLPEHDFRTGEITETQGVPQPARDLTSSQALNGQVAPIQPGMPLVDSAPGAMGLAEPAYVRDGGMANTKSAQPIQPETAARSAEPETASASDGGQELSVSSAPASAIESEDSASDAGQAPSNLTTFTPKPLRPYCLNPGTKCGGQGKKHCWKCQQAHDEKQGAA